MHIGAEMILHDANNFQMVNFVHILRMENFRAYLSVIYVHYIIIDSLG